MRAVTITGTRKTEHRGLDDYTALFAGYVAPFSEGAHFFIGGAKGIDFFSSGHLRGFEGVCELYVGDPAVAHDRFARSVEALSAPREQVQRAIVTTDQALARIRLGEPMAAADLLHECVTAASTTGGRVPAIRLRRARQELRPWRREEWVADLDDHLMDMLGA